VPFEYRRHQEVQSFVKNGPQQSQHVGKGILNQAVASISSTKRTLRINVFVCCSLCLPSTGASAAGVVAPSSAAGAAASIKMSLGKQISGITHAGNQYVFS